MEISELLLGPIGRIFAYSNIVIVLSLIFIVSFRLYLSRKKKAYLSLAISLVIIIIQYLFMISIELLNEKLTLEAMYFEKILQIISFILINMGIYQLYNRTNRKENLIFSSFLFITIILFIIYLTGTSFHSIWIDLYLSLLIFLGFYLIKPFIAQTIKYQLGLLVYLIAHFAYILNRYIFTMEDELLTVLHLFLPILFYFILFLFVFDRVVELMQAAYESAITDGLTGLYNRRYLVSHISGHIRRKDKISLIFCDIDNFKKLNDTKGHQKGDDVLKQVAKIMKEETEYIGIAGRYGGEELVIVLSDTNIKASEFAESLRKRIQLEASVTVSIGISTYREGVSSEELLKQSDHAMYHSKKTGKNKVTRFQTL